MRVAITLLFLSASLANAAKNDEINFDDLQRSGGELSKTVTIPKISSEANAYMRNYLDDDSARIEKLNAWRGSGSGSNNSSDGNGGAEWSCKFECLGPMFSGSRNVYTVNVMAPDDSKAWENSKRHAKETCSNEKSGQYPSLLGLCKKK